mmetsp:Transcript_22588/g.70769  ORF Transcript_22588/g.70769 Transcript_22588/m.70769 type:complete len:95 (-) Transcript_22588:1381-1665(-)
MAVTCARRTPARTPSVLRCEITWLHWVPHSSAREEEVITCIDCTVVVAVIIPSACDVHLCADIGEVSVCMCAWQLGHGACGRGIREPSAEPAAS